MTFRLLKIFRFLSLIGISVILCSSLSAGGDIFKVKSAYLINFVKFINWPESKSKEITVGFIGDSKLEAYLIETKSLAEKRAKIKINLVHFNSSREVDNCDILYCSDHKSLKNDLDLVQKCKENNILTVTSKNLRFPDNSCINFLIVNNKLRFEINNDALKNNSLKASAQLLKLSYKR